MVKSKTLLKFIRGMRVPKVVRPAKIEKKRPFKKRKRMWRCRKYTPESKKLMV